MTKYSQLITAIPNIQLQIFNMLHYLIIFLLTAIFATKIGMVKYLEKGEYVY